MIYNRRTHDVEVANFNDYTKCLDNMIHVGMLAYDTVENKYVNNYSNSSTAQFTVMTSIFPPKLDAHPYRFPFAPSINKGFANSVSDFVYNGIKQLFEYSKSNVSIEYNTVSFNLTKTSVFKHRHGFASPHGKPVNTEVFTYKLTDFSKQDLSFILYTNIGIERYALEKNCSFIFNSIQYHETEQKDDNYYGFMVFEKWPD